MGILCCSLTGAPLLCRQSMKRSVNSRAVSNSAMSRDHEVSRILATPMWRSAAVKRLATWIGVIPYFAASDARDCGDIDTTTWRTISDWPACTAAVFSCSTFSSSSCDCIDTSTLSADVMHPLKSALLASNMHYSIASGSPACQAVVERNAGRLQSRLVSVVAHLKILAAVVDTDGRLANNVNASVQFKQKIAATQPTCASTVDTLLECFTSTGLMHDCDGAM